MLKKERNKLDKLFSELTRERDGRCLRCGTKENLQCAHIISRKHLNTRWDMDNLITLCVKDHLYWAHKEPLEFVWWLEKRFGKEHLEKLKKKSLEIKKIYYEDIISRLTNKSTRDNIVIDE